MVNGQVVTTLGSKAVPSATTFASTASCCMARSVIATFAEQAERVRDDGEDPEGRPTVMKFFEKMHERLYP